MTAPAIRSRAFPDLDALLASGAIRLPGTAGSSGSLRVADGHAAAQAHQTPDFRLYTAAAAINPDAATSPDTGNPLVQAIGSSTICDLQGDTMELSALESMQSAPPGLAIFVNHEYTVPEDIVGRLYDYPTIAMKRAIADLALCVELLPAVNPRAAQLHAGIQAGVRQGVSIGCMITASQWYDSEGNPIADDMVDFWDVIEGRVHLHILGVDPLEWSFVGIPANQRSWVQYAAQGIFRRALRTGNAADAQRVAPLVRAWFPTEYSRDVLDIAATDPALRQTLDQTAPRREKAGTHGRQIIWRPDSATFALRNSATRTAKEISRERVAALLAGETTPAGADLPATAPDATATDPVMDPAMDPAMTAATEPTVIRQATGKSDWPLGARDAAWDNGEAHKRIVEWAGGTDDPDVGKLKSVHFYTPDDADDQKSVSKYKLLFCDVVDGDTVKAMPRALMACWGAHGVEHADIPQEDKDAIKKKLSAYAARMRKEFDDPDIAPPWDEKEDAAPALDATKAAGSEEAEAGGGMPDAKDVAVSADGTHAMCKGTHAHSHSTFGSQGGDDNHEHEHTHDGDANHDHHGADDNDNDNAPEDQPEAQEPEQQDAAPAPDVTASAGAGASGTSDPARAAALALAQTLAAQYGFTVRAEAAGAATSALQPDARKCDLVDNDQDAQRVITLVSAADCAIDELMDILRIPDLDSDDDEGPEGDQQPAEDEPGEDGGGDNSDVAGPRYPLGSALESARPSIARAHHLIRAGLRLLYTREGRRHSAEDMASIQAIHDAVYKMTDGMCCSAPPATNDNPAADGGEGDDADAQQPAATQPQDSPAGGVGGDPHLRGMPAPHAPTPTPTPTPYAASLLATLTDLAGTLKAANGLPAVRAQVAALEASLAQAGERQADLLDQLDRAWQRPMGRPTQMQMGLRTSAYTAAAPHRASAASDPAALATAGSEPIPPVTADALSPEGHAVERARALATAKALTTTRYVAGVGQCRLWPAGVGADAVAGGGAASARPAISPEQRMALEMGFAALARTLSPAPPSPDALIAAYTSGSADALIPIVNDGE